MSKLPPSLLAVAAGLWLTSAAAQAQVGPFGVMDSPAPGQVGLSGSVAVIGWALDNSGLINHIDFLVDGKVVAGSVGVGLPSTAIYGTPRPDVFAVFPDIPNSLNSGFVANIDTTAFIDGVHVISVRAFNGSGVSNVIDSRTVQIINNGSTLPPFGFLDVPLDKASILCSTDSAFEECSPSFNPGTAPVSFYKNVVAGWALDVGARLDRGQVSYVELLIDGQIIANSRRDCVRIGSVLANCYGVNRPDVARAYPGYVNADNSGFLFLFALEPNFCNGLFDVLVPGPFGFPILGGFVSSGKHTLSIRLGDEKETVTQIAAISVDVLCDEGASSDRPAFGYIDVPTELQAVKGVVTFSGWAFDYDNGGQAPWVNGIAAIVPDIDGQPVLNLDGVRTVIPAPFIARIDVPANDFRVPGTPGTPGPSAFVGWSFTFDTGRYSDTQHDLVIYAVDRLGFRSEIGRRKFVIFNNTRTK